LSIKTKPQYKLLCRNLPFETLEQEIAGLFYNVENVELVRYKETKKSKGYNLILQTTKRT